nr:unnamed protein product [Callosobruchus analis]
MDLFASSSSSEDEADVMETANRENRRIPPRIKGFINSTVHNYNAKEFQSDFRVTRETFNVLKDKLSPYLKRAEASTGKFQVPVDDQLLSVLWLLATPDSYRSVGSRFDMAKSTLFNCFTRVIMALNKIAPDIIKWPPPEERQSIKRQFQNIRNLPGVVGAVDGTYVPIKAPHENPEVYVNRKCFHGITLQCISAPNLKFLDCFTGYPSSVSDNRIFRNSDIFFEFMNNNNVYFQEDEFIIGDKAYPVTKWCIPPYIERGYVTAQQRNFKCSC